jgi:hypothetical protein
MGGSYVSVQRTELKQNILRKVEFKKKKVSLQSKYIKW